ncbi:hypothetical protein [Flavivirga eckloniae]|uniref:Uncharacterized protein n=1 Tax=Flavivirga eckloniae TaxID=1803846 RepID=A0A2K9PR14_9FLAO|nr:hypothetical protein [Flavivirga eckloniae]AUP79513.1 hypothetical protein C1H87_12670 [Flavivirga eckloniae]
MVNRKNKHKRGYNQPNFFGTVQNVFIASMKKGQFVIDIIGITLLTMVLKLSSTDTKEITFK